MTATEPITATDTHPAPFSAAVLERMRDLILRECEMRGVEMPTVLDPFAGSGLVHSLDHIAETIGVEIEPEWAGRDPRTLLGDATALPLPDGSVNMIVTSPCYGNRLADTYDGRGKCRACAGSGTGRQIEADQWDDCDRCGGTGHDVSKRLTYAISLGHTPSPGSAGAMQWGSAYRALHQAAYHEMARVMTPRPNVDYALGWPAFINMSDHPRDKAMIHVVDWHVGALREAGFWIDEVQHVGTRRWGYGRNGQVRADGERIVVARLG